MAIIPCPNCGNPISDKAKVCPKCGAEINDKLNSNLDNAVSSGDKIADENTCSKTTGNKSLLIILVVILCLVIAGALFFFLQNNSGKLAIDENNLNKNSVCVEEGGLINNGLTGPIYISGLLGEIPFTLDLNISEDGTISGKYWNVLYDIPLSVSGNCLSNNDFDLTLGKGSTQSSLYLKTDGNSSCTGIWGTKKIPVVADMQKGVRPSSPLPKGDYMRLRIKGNGINKIARLGDDYFYYEDQGTNQGHILKASQTNSESYILSYDNGEKVANIDLDENRLNDVTGKTFEVTILKQREGNQLPSHEATKEENRESQNSKSGPRWLQGTWKLDIEGPNGIHISTYHLTINGNKAHLIEGKVDKYNGEYKIIDNRLIVGSRTYYINEAYKRIDYQQYSFYKVGGDSSYRSYQDGTSGFRTPSDVFSYLSGKTFKGGGVSARIATDALYLNGNPVSGAPRISNITSHSATIRASSPYMGGQDIRFYLNADNGTLTLESGEKLYYQH